MQQSKNHHVKTIFPSERPSFNEWCKLFNVSALYKGREGMNNAQRIMSLWNGYSNNKEYFQFKITIDEQ